MEFVTWLIALPTAIFLFFFPAPVAAPQEAQIATSSPSVEVIEVRSEIGSTTKEKAISALQKEGIEVQEVKPVIIPPLVFPVAPLYPETPEPVAPAPVAPAPVGAPVEEAPVPTTLAVSMQNSNSKVFGGNCSQLRFTVKANKPVNVSFYNPETQGTVTQFANFETVFTYIPQATSTQEVLIFTADDARVEHPLQIVGSVYEEVLSSAFESIGEGRLVVKDSGQQVSSVTGKCL